MSGGGPIGIAASATLGGYGSVAGDVTNHGIVAVGNALPAFAGGPTGTFTVGGLLNQGAVNLAGSSVGNVLVVNRNYIGAGGTMAFNAVLAGDGSPADNLIINGGTASGSTAISVFNKGGQGALTLGNGIPLVQAINGGTTASGAFSLANPTGAIEVGFADYRLFHGGVNGSNPSDWFLRSTFEVLPPTPTPPTSPTSPTRAATDTQRALDNAPDQAAAGPTAAWHLSDHRATGGDLWRGAADRPTDGSHHARHAA